MALKVLFEDDHFIAISKPCGWVVDGENPEDSLVLALSDQLGRRVFPFHRIDRATSGIVLFGKTRVHAAAITQAFEKKQIRKSYLAVVEGNWERAWSRVMEPIEGQEAMTTFRVLSLNENTESSRTLIEALPKTGRTHQIRIHCASKKCPIVGDTFYDLANSRVPPHEQALHAYRLAFRHPADGQSISLVDIPEEWRQTYLKDFDWESIQSKLAGKKEGET